MNCYNHLTASKDSQHNAHWPFPQNIMHILNVDYKERGIYICINENKLDGHTSKVLGLAVSKCVVIGSDFNI